jgi:ubiquitin-small subunit ribosomal protein S27Ae
MKKIEFFKIEGDRINRFRKYCPKCGPGVFLAEHKNRFSCGKCGYTEFKGGGKPSKPKPVEEKSVEKPVDDKKQEPVQETTPAVEGKPEEPAKEAADNEETSEVKDEEKPAEEASPEKKE